MKKRILSLFLALVLLLSVVPAVSAVAYQLTYTKATDSNGKEYITVTGFTGTLPETLVIPEQIDGCPVREIGKEAFIHAKTTRVELPSGLKKICNGAFELSDIHSFSLPDGLEYIGRNAFFADQAVGELIVPASVTFMGQSCFGGNKFSRVMLLPENATLGGYPFDMYNPVFAHRSVLEGLKELDSGFTYLIVYFEDLPIDISAVPICTEGVFQYATLNGEAYVISYSGSTEMTVTVPDTFDGCPVTALLPFAFLRKQKIRKLVLPDTVEVIGDWCFSGCGATLERLPSNLKKLGYSAFYDINVMGRAGTAITLVDATIPEGVTEIPDRCFASTLIDALVLPSKLETIGAEAFAYSTLTSVTFLGSVKTIGDSAFATTDLTEVTLPEGLESLGDSAFNGTRSLVKAVMPRSLKTVGREVFIYDAATRLTVYGYVDTPIFAYCKANRIPFFDLESGELIELPYEITVDGIVYTIDPTEGTARVYGRTQFATGDILVIPESVDGYSVTSIGENGLADLSCSGLFLPDTVTYIESYAISSYGENELFIRMPNNEVYLADSFCSDSGRVLFYFLPEGFTLAENCRDKGNDLLWPKCIGYEKHGAFLREDRLVTIDGTSEDRIILSTKGVFRLDGNAYTALWLSDVYPMPSSIGGIPITRVAASCKIDSDRVYLGENVRVVEDGAFVNDPTYVQLLYVPECIEHLPADYFPMEDYPCTLYGTSGGYAEQYAKEHGMTFFALDKTPFTDVAENDWYYPYVFTVYRYGLMNGTSKTTFAPNAATTRAMVVQVLFNLAGEAQNVPVVHIFDDVKHGDWYFLAVTWAALTGVSTGTTETTFSPNDPVTREQLAAFLYRFATLCGIDCKTDGDLSKFADQNQISDYAKDAISWAVGAGIINGKSPTTVDPRAYATRAEIAAMLCRLLDYLNNISEE